MEEGFPGVAEYAEAHFILWRVVGYEIDSGVCLMDEPCAQPSEVASVMSKGIRDCRTGEHNYAVGVMEYRFQVGWLDVAYWQTGSPELKVEAELLRPPLDQVLNQVAKSSGLSFGPAAPQPQVGLRMIACDSESGETVEDAVCGTPSVFADFLIDYIRKCTNEGLDQTIKVVEQRGGTDTVVAFWHSKDEVLTVAEDIDLPLKHLLGQVASKTGLDVEFCLIENDPEEAPEHPQTPMPSSLMDYFLKELPMTTRREWEMGGNKVGTTRHREAELDRLLREKLKTPRPDLHEIEPG